MRTRWHIESRKEFAGTLNKAAEGGGISVMAQDGLLLGYIKVFV